MGGQSNRSLEHVKSLTIVLVLGNERCRRCLLILLFLVSERMCVLYLIHGIGIDLLTAYAPILLARRAKKIRAERGLPANDKRSVRTRYESENWQSVRSLLVSSCEKHSHTHGIQMEPVLRQCFDSSVRPVLPRTYIASHRRVHDFPASPQLSYFFRAMY
jgi:hypothetical protein